MGFGLTIADASVAIGADFGKFSGDVNKAVTTELGQAGKTGAATLNKELADGGKKGAASLGASLKEGLSLKNILAGVGLGTGMQLFNQIAQGITGTFGAMVGGAAQMERYNTQLTKLLGSAGAAKDRLAELARFGASTPFELPEIVEASRTLQVFTKGVLATGDGLRLVGDVAAGTGTPIKETAIWFGRLYDAMQSGRPFGEAAQRLQEMGALSGDGRAQVEKLTGAVKNGSMTMNQAWAGVSKEFSSFSGLMDKQSATLEGKWSNLQDAINMGLTNIGTQGLPLFKGAIDLAIPAVLAITGGLTLLAENADIVIPVIGAFVAIWLYHLVPALLASIPVWWATAAPVIATAAPFLALAAVVALFALAWKSNLFGVQDIAKGVFGVVGGIAKSIVGTLLVVADTIAGIAGALPGPWQQGAKDLQASLDQMRADVDNWGKETAGIAGDAMDGTASAIADGGDQVAAAADDAFGTIPDSIDTQGKLATFLASLIPGNIAKATRDKRKSLTDQWDQLVADLKNQRTPMAEAASIIGALTSQKLADGLRSGDPMVKAEAEQLQADALARLRELNVGAGEIGKNAGKSLSDGLSSKDPLVRNSALATKNVLESSLGTVDGGPAGEKAVQSMIDAANGKSAMDGAWTAGKKVLAQLLGAMSGKATVSFSVGSSGKSGTSYGGGGPGGESGGSSSRTVSKTPVALDVGMPYVPWTMPAIIHPREAVLTAKQADEWRAGGRGGDSYEFNFPNYVGAREELMAAIASVLRLKRS